MLRRVAGWRQPLREEHRSVSTLISDLRAESGQTMAEYAVVLGVITIAVVVTLRLLSTGIKNTLTNVIAAL
jgi:Flp pilus assembly pilin Flp